MVGDAYPSFARVPGAAKLRRLASTDPKQKFAIAFTTMKTTKQIAFLAISLFSVSALHGATTLPHLEDFSTGSEGFNMTPLSGSLNFNNFTYSVDGTGGVALFDVTSFLGIASLANFDGLGVIGDWQWSGAPTHNVHSFAVTSNDNAAFALTSLDWATGNGGPPTIYTITGFKGLSQVAQVADIDLKAANIYGLATGSEIVATDLGPGDDSGYGLHLAFSGADWSNIDRFVFSATGNDILVALDNIQFSPASIPEPSSCALLIGAGVWVLGTRRRTHQK